MNKKNFCVFLVMVLFLISGCSSSKKQAGDKETLTVEDWINVNDEDVYSFYIDGTGKHNSVPLRYEYDTKSRALYITEGIASLTQKEFTLELEGEYNRLIAKDLQSLYVQKTDYPSIAEAVRMQNEGILVEVRRWRIKAQDSGGELVSDFYGDGKGYIRLYKNLNLLMEADTTWEMIDNNTLKMSFDYSGQGYEYVLDIANDNGNYRLTTPGNESLYHVPMQ